MEKVLFIMHSFGGKVKTKPHTFSSPSAENVWGDFMMAPFSAALPSKAR